MHNNWINSLYAQNFLRVEKTFTDRALRQISGPSVLLLGPDFSSELLAELDFPQLVSVASPRSTKSASIKADNAFLPFANRSFASVVVPHALEQNELPHQVLREAHRVLQSEGHLLLTCFNPYSLLGLQHTLRQKGAPQGQFYSLNRVKDWLHLLGFEVVGGAMYHYAPISKSLRLNRNLAFLNALGDRWLPMFGGSYLITARKREVGVRLVDKQRFGRKQGRGQLATAVARKTACESANQKK